MKALVMLFLMIFLHIYADFNMQGILSKMKQRRWWEKQFVNPSEFNRSKYKRDYQIAIIAHGFEWSFVVMIPMLYKVFVDTTSNDISSMAIYTAFLITNAYFHCVIDDLKANEGSINLITDQELHLVQIFVTWIAWTLLFGWK